MTENMNDTEILAADLKDLPMTENFYLRSKLMGYTNLEQIIATPPAMIVSKDEFSYSWMGELIRFLMSHNMLHKLQPLPGSSSYLSAGSFS